MDKCSFCGSMKGHNRLCSFAIRNKTNLDSNRKFKVKNNYKGKRPFRLDRDLSGDDTGQSIDLYSTGTHVYN